MGNQDISSNDEKDRPRNSSGQDSSSSIDLVRHMNSLPSFEKGESSSPKDSGQLNRSSGELGKLDRSSEELGDKSNKNFSADYMKRLQRIKSDSKKYTEGEMLDQSQSLKIAHMVDRTISNWDNAKSDFENVSKQIKLDAKSTVDDDRLLCEKLEKLNKISDDISKLIDWGRANRSKIGDSGYITSAKYSNMKSLQQEWIDLKSTFEEMIDNCSKAIEDYKHEIQSNAGEQNTHLNQRIDSLEKLRSNLNTSMEKINKYPVKKHISDYLNRYKKKAYSEDIEHINDLRKVILKAVINDMNNNNFNKSNYYHYYKEIIKSQLDMREMKTEKAYINHDIEACLNDKSISGVLSNKEIGDLIKEIRTIRMRKPMEKDTENLVETYIQFANEIKKIFETGIITKEESKEKNEINDISFRNNILKMVKKYISDINDVQDRKKLLLDFGIHELDGILTDKRIQEKLYRCVMEDIQEFTQNERPTDNQWHLHDHETFTLRNEIGQMVGLSGLEQRAVEPIQSTPEQRAMEPIQSTPEQRAMEPRQRTLVQRARRTMRHALRLLVCGSPSQQEHRDQHQRMQEESRRLWGQVLRSPQTQRDLHTFLNSASMMAPFSPY